MFTKFYETMIAGDRWMLIIEGLGNTLLIALCAILIGTCIGCILALFKLSKSVVLRGIATGYTTIIRGIPLATQLMIFYFVIFAKVGIPSVAVAIIGFGINSGAYVAEIFRAGIQGVDLGQTEAGRSLGLNKKQTMIKIVLPQAVKAVLPTYTSEFIALIKETSIVSFITVVDLTKASDMIRNATYDP
ncbi:MAG: amino acid ABC transporter permease, partial [Oscillospiraceae bacterium]